MAAPQGPALPWGRGNDGAAQHSGDTNDEFESSLRKIMLSAALGGLVDGRPAKRARTDDGEPADALTRAYDTVEAFQSLAHSDEAVPADLAARQRIQVCSRSRFEMADCCAHLPQRAGHSVFLFKTPRRSSGSWRMPTGPRPCGGVQSWSRGRRQQHRRRGMRHPPSRQMR